MASTTKQIIEMIDMLPDNERDLAFEIIKRLVYAWDPDYTKVTEAEAESLKNAEEALVRGEYVRHEDINWD